MNDKDYSLLRPFDAEKAKNGEPITFRYGVLEPMKWIGGPDVTGYICTQTEDGRFTIGLAMQYVMAPLAWVEGKPVYKGDQLYYKLAGCIVTVKRACNNYIEAWHGRVIYPPLLEELTWDFPQEPTISAPKKRVMYQALIEDSNGPYVSSSLFSNEARAKEKYPLNDGSSRRFIRLLTESPITVEVPE